MSKKHVEKVVQDIRHYVAKHIKEKKFKLVYVFSPFISNAYSDDELRDMIKDGIKLAESDVDRFIYIDKIARLSNESEFPAHEDDGHKEFLIYL